ncbi:NAD(+)/NADH kinase [Thermomicrobium sp. 4228-Ro]|uniref:NAD(+)/NADH kinase n=1 Tax=Thermomicrobium sp. 4228-Ro TaxID=2993937 RepID=UPI002248AFD7|nr:NAD(+)/NADH kinase [Thermomicrobium sp. 4228-Ro]MCX2726696.1 NAD(+)/NADH kinase [Thermomicrobium sp. 4228-Ro]
MTGHGSGASVGIIANPNAGKDVRRLVALASTFDNQEKVRIVRRVLSGLVTTGVERVWYLRDSFGIVERAAAGLALPLDLRPIPVPCEFTASDSERAAAWLAEHDVACIVTLGGDGTNRVVARGCGALPLVPIATGTNNVFPFLVDGTIAGLVAGLFATGQLSDCLERVPRLEVWVDGTLVDIALIDVAVSRERFIGSRAIWDPTTIELIVVARLLPGVIGLAAVPAALIGHTDEQQGAVVELGAGSLRVTAPLAPGLVRDIAVRSWRTLPLGASLPIDRCPCTLALDGERELHVEQAAEILVRLSPNGPFVLDPRRAVRAAARRGCFLSEQ